MPLLLLVFSPQIASITRSGISPQPELRLQYLLQIWKALCMGFRYIACILHSLIAKNVRFFNAMTLAKTGPMGSFAHSSTSTRPLILISIATPIVQPTGSSKNLKFLKVIKWLLSYVHFTVFDLMGSFFSRSQTCCWTFDFVLKKTSKVIPIFTTSPQYP